MMKNKLTIKQVREKFKITQKRMGHLMGMPQPSIARLESGKRGETKEHLAHLAALMLIKRHKLDGELLDKLK